MRRTVSKKQRMRKPNSKVKKVVKRKKLLKKYKCVSIKDTKSNKFMVTIEQVDKAILKLHEYKDENNM